MNRDILIKAPDNLCGLSREAVVQELQNRLKGRVVYAFLFGSFLTGSFSRFSDIDLILVQETGLSFFERGLEFSDLREWLPAIEPLVYTPDEFERLTHDPTPGFWQSVVQTMRRIV
jgi:predicted nucleotidyltransferase